MKTTIFAFCLLCATAAFGQSANVLSGYPQPLVLADHPLHASEHAMAQESSLLGSSAYSYAQGERPLWEFGTDKPREVSLGEVARAYRNGHVIDRKPSKVSASD
jgi:hypothetical protein